MSNVLRDFFLPGQYKYTTSIVVVSAYGSKKKTYLQVLRKNKKKRALLQKDMTYLTYRLRLLCHVVHKAVSALYGVPVLLLFFSAKKLDPRTSLFGFHDFSRTISRTHITSTEKITKKRRG